MTPWRIELLIGGTCSKGLPTDPTVAQPTKGAPDHRLAQVWLTNNRGAMGVTLGGRDPPLNNAVGPHAPNTTPTHPPPTPSPQVPQNGGDSLHVIQNVRLRVEDIIRALQLVRSQCSKNRNR